MKPEDLKTALNAFSLISCGFSKVPQIKRNWRAQSTEGLSLVSLMLENLSWSISFCYYVYHHYPVFDYLEYPLLLMQNVLQICLFLSITDPVKWSRSQLIIATSMYFTWINIMCSPEVVPAFVMKSLLRLSIPISPLSKLAQISTIIDTKRGDLISPIPWAIFAASSFARIITVAMETGDENLILSYSLSVFLNLAVIVTAFIFSGGNASTEKQQQNHVISTQQQNHVTKDLQTESTQKKNE